MRCLNVPPQEDMRNRPPVTAEEARTKRTAERKARIKNAAAKKPIKAKVRDVAAAATVPGPPSIVELARALKSDVDLIYEWVYSNVDFYCNYGTYKGAFGTLVDEIAGPFDQATLMVTLLRQAGYTASYVVGSVRLTTAQLENLFGTVDTSTLYPSLDVLNAGGIPYTAAYDGSGNLLYVDLYETSGTETIYGYCWVQVNIGGTDYVFDPSLKTYNRTTSSLDFASITDFDLSTLQTNAQAGTTFADDNSWLQNLNTDTYTDPITHVETPGIRPLFTSYATNLLNWIQENAFAASMTDIIGGAEIQPLPPGPLRQTSLPYQTTGVTPVIYSGDLDPAYRAQWNVTFGGINVTENLDDPLYGYGQRLTITFTTATDGNVIPVLKCNGTTLGTGTEQTPNTYVSGQFNTPLDQSVYTDPDGVYFVGLNNGPSSQSMVDYHRQILLQNMADGGASTDEDVLGESLAILFYGYHAQHFLLEKIFSQLGQVYFAWTLMNGLMGYNSVYQGPYSDFIDEFSCVSLIGDYNAPDNVWAAAQYMLSGFEGGIQQQTFGNTGICTLRYLDVANTDGQKIFSTNKFNWEEGSEPVEPQLVNWDTWISYLTGRLETKHQIFIHQDGATTVGSVSAGGWIENLLGFPAGHVPSLVEKFDDPLQD
jgi:transglutaminase-like putative cysteine protease